MVRDSNIWSSGWAAFFSVSASCYASLGQSSWNVGRSKTNSRSPLVSAP